MKAVQVHAVPSSVQEPRGPFPPELRGFNPGYIGLDPDGTDLSGMEWYEDDANIAAQPEIVVDYQPEEGYGNTDFPDGATAQNNFRPVKYYRCKDCLARVSEHDLDAHDCE